MNFGPKLDYLCLIFRAKPSYKALPNLSTNIPKIANISTTFLHKLYY